MKSDLNEINNCERHIFIALLGAIYEHSSWAAKALFDKRPFDSIDKLQLEIAQIVADAQDDIRLELLCSHPQLAGKQAQAGTLTSASRQEQDSAGLNQCSPKQVAQIDKLNQDYQTKFGFPFIIAVTGLNRFEIIEFMQNRLANEAQIELETAFIEVDKIAQIRLAALFC